MPAYEWDDEKAETNFAKHGVRFEMVRGFDWANTVSTAQNVNGETRYLTLGLIGTRIHALVWTERATSIRVISLRKANKREESHYAAQT